MVRVERSRLLRKLLACVGSESFEQVQAFARTPWRFVLYEFASLYYAIRKKIPFRYLYSDGAGRENRTLISSLENLHTNHCTIPAARLIIANLSDKDKGIVDGKH